MSTTWSMIQNGNAFNCYSKQLSKWKDNLFMQTSVGSSNHFCDTYRCTFVCIQFIRSSFLEICRGVWDLPHWVIYLLPPSTPMLWVHEVITAIFQTPWTPASLTHWGREKIDAILQTTFSNAFSRMKMYEFRLGFHWSLFLRVQLTIFQHWFR